MSFSGEHFQQSLRESEQRELLGGESMLMADMHRLLTPSKIEKGLHISFGADRAALEKVLDELKIGDNAGEHEAQGLEIVDAMTSTAIATSYLGKSVPGLRQLPLLDAVDMLQAERWGTSNFPSESPRNRLAIQSNKVNSKIILANTYTNKAGVKVIDTTLPGVEIGAGYRYLPEIYGEQFSGNIADVLDEIGREALLTPGEKLGKLATRTLTNDELLIMPDRAYYMKVGPLRALSPLGDYSDLRTVSTKSSYNVNNGRLLPRPNPYEEAYANIAALLKA